MKDNIYKYGSCWQQLQNSQFQQQSLKQVEKKYLVQLINQILFYIAHYLPALHGRTCPMTIYFFPFILNYIFAHFFVQLIRMSLTDLFQRNIKLEMRLVHIVDRKPRQQTKLQPINEEDFVVSLEAVSEWSQDNLKLYQLILENGMAEFICNKEFLFEFYQTLSFVDKQLSNIDSLTLKLSNLRTLNLVSNNISTIENIPQSCRQLYIDFNQVSAIKNGKDHQLQLLSISHNQIGDRQITDIYKCFPQLRCFNVSHNKIIDLRLFVNNLANFHHLKVLVAYQNPISMLKIYYAYITDHILLSHFDGAKYVKEEPPKPQPVKVEEKKEVKEEKKDAKKDNKKGAKIEQKPVEQPPKVEVPPPVVKKELTSEDFQRVRINLTVSNLQQFSGNLYDASLFPADTDPKKIQTCYWIKYRFLGKQVEQKQKNVSFENTVVQGDSNRIGLDCSINQSFAVNEENFSRFNEGINIEVWQIQPKMVKDAQTLELKPEIKESQPVAVESILGAVRIDLRTLHLNKKKEVAFKYRLFSAEAVTNPFFYDPFSNEDQIINKKKEQFERDMKKLQQERLKKAEEQQLLRQQKKGKDQKKAADKKATKKDGKDAVVQQKKRAQKCEYAIDSKLYVAVDEQRICKGKQLLCVQIKIL